MFNWLFKKRPRHLTQEQQLDKEVGDSIRYVPLKEMLR